MENAYQHVQIQDEEKPGRSCLPSCHFRASPFFWWDFCVSNGHHCSNPLENEVMYTTCGIKDMIDTDDRYIRYVIHVTPTRTMSERKHGSSPTQRSGFGVHMSQKPIFPTTASPRCKDSELAVIASWVLDTISMINIVLRVFQNRGSTISSFQKLVLEKIPSVSWEVLSLSRPNFLQ